uniref:Uncharacterized protein n=1 Tax=Aegilops tauschii subsp. strangulata TaxID=200361 RepID=A0A453LWJ9_AEGTS
MPLRRRRQGFRLHQPNPPEGPVTRAGRHRLLRTVSAPTPRPRSFSPPPGRRCSSRSSSRPASAARGGRRRGGGGSLTIPCISTPIPPATKSQQHVLHRRAAAAVAERHRRWAVDEHVRPTRGSLALAARHELGRLLQPARPADVTACTARDAGARQGHVHLRGARGGDGRLLAGEPARAGRVRVRAQGGAPQRQGGGREAAQVRERSGGARVPGRGGHHRPGAPPPPRVPRWPLHRRRQPHARLRVRPQQDARVPPPWGRVAGDGMADEAAHRARGGEGARLPARRLPSTDHPPRHQVGQHPPGQQLRSHGGGLRAGQADVRRHHARLDAGHGHVRVPGAGVRVEREADGEVGRLLLRRDAGRAPDGAAAHRRHRAPGPGGRPRRMGEAGPVARARRRRLRRRGRPEAAGQLRPGGDGARGRQRRRLRPPLGQEAPEDEPDREGAGGRHVAGGPERRGAAGAEQAVRGGGGVVQLRHEPDQRGGRGEPRVQRQVRTALAGQQRQA